MARLMGILNVTPDSFSDGGRFDTVERAVEHGRELHERGAAVVDVGGESTRPGSKRVAAEEQKRRIIDVIAGLAADKPGPAISVDTTLAPVAEAAADAGATILNDISAGRDDPAMLELAAERGLAVCLMHMQGSPETMQDDPQYDDVVEDVLRFLSERVECAVRAGVSEDMLIIDPGIGFGKTAADNLRLLSALERFVALGPPVLLGASRKRFISAIDRECAPHERVAGGCATTVLGYLAGVEYFRVHDVFEHKQALDVCRAIRSA